MKACLTCKISKPLEAFNKNRAKKDNRQTSCRECEKPRKKAYYDSNPQRFIGYSRNRQHKLANWLNEIKSALVCPCGESHIACLDFHHLDPSQKEGGISDLMRKGNFSKVKKELEKCVVLCANCHRKLHFLERSPLGPTG